MAYEYQPIDTSLSLSGPLSGRPQAPPAPPKLDLETESNFGWGDALVAASKIAEMASRLPKGPQAPGLGGVAPLGNPASSTSPFGGGGGMPRPMVRSPGGIGSALLGGR